jgi:hypothetical protein
LNIFRRFDGQIIKITPKRQYAALQASKKATAWGEALDSESLSPFLSVVI